MEGKLYSTYVWEYCCIPYILLCDQAHIWSCLNTHIDCDKVLVLIGAYWSWSSTHIDHDLHITPCVLYITHLCRHDLKLEWTGNKLVNRLVQFQWTVLLYHCRLADTRVIITHITYINHLQWYPQSLVRKILLDIIMPCAYHQPLFTYQSSGLA